MDRLLISGILDTLSIVAFVVLLCLASDHDHLLETGIGFTIYVITLLRLTLTRLINYQLTMLTSRDEDFDDVDITNNQQS